MKSWKVFNLIRKGKKWYAEVARIYSKNKSPICEIMKKQKEIHASFAVAPQTAKVMTTVHDKCLVKIEKALYLSNNIFWERGKDRIHIQAYLVLLLFTAFFTNRRFVATLLRASLLAQFFQCICSLPISGSRSGRSHNISNPPPAKWLQLAEGSDDG